MLFHFTYTDHAICNYKGNLADLAPRKATDGSAAFDLVTLHDVWLKKGERALIHTGLYLAIPGGQVGLITPRSGLAANHGITIVNSPGVIDSDYRGEVCVLLQNTGDRTWDADAGDRVAQLLVMPLTIVTPKFIMPSEFKALTTERAGGFGSTGR